MVCVEISDCVNFYLWLNRFMKKIILFTLLIGLNSNSQTLNETHFKTDYIESTKNFLITAHQVLQAHSKAQLKYFENEKNKIPLLFWPLSNEKKNLVVLISGVHGAEGFVGSAVQNHLLESLLKVEQRKPYDLLVVHGFNPFGMINKRRVNENNMDLNRSFIIDRKAHKFDDSSYLELDAFLNPTDQPDPTIWGHFKFIGSSIFHIVKYKLENLRRSILQGQYSKAKGLFYGGNQNPYQEQLLNLIHDQYAIHYKNIIIIDLHTGYGEKGRLHLLSNRFNSLTDVQNQTHKNLLIKIFDQKSINFSDEKNFYNVNGEMVGYLNHLNFQNPAVSSAVITFEYGTLDSQKTLGSIESLRRMVLENQNYWHGESDYSAEIKSSFEEMFNPQDSAWRKKIIEQTFEQWSKIEKYFAEN